MMCIRVRDGSEIGRSGGGLEYSMVTVQGFERFFESELQVRVLFSGGYCNSYGYG